MTKCEAYAHGAGRRPIYGASGAAARFHDAPPCLHGMNSQFGRVAASRILPLAGPGVGDDKIAPIRLEDVRWGVAFDWLRSSAQIHLAALHLRPLPAGIDPL